jgi:hypothetical protein
MTLSKIVRYDKDNTPGMFDTSHNFNLLQFPLLSNFVKRDSLKREKAYKQEVFGAF